VSGGDRKGTKTDLRRAATASRGPGEDMRSCEEERGVTRRSEGPPQSPLSSQPCSRKTVRPSPRSYVPRKNGCSRHSCAVQRLVQSSLQLRRVGRQSVMRPAREEQGEGQETHSRQRFMRSTTCDSSLPWYHSAMLSSEAGIGPYGSGEFSTIKGGLSARTSECRLACAGVSYSRMLVSKVRSAQLAPRGRVSSCSVQCRRGKRGKGTHCAARRSAPSCGAQRWP